MIVILLRLLARRLHLPRGYSYALWGLVLFRLLCPFAIPSPLSLFPASPPMAKEIIYEDIPAIESGISSVDLSVNRILKGALAVRDPAAQKLPAKAKAGEAKGGQIELDYADENRIVLHGKFGICQFERSGAGFRMTDSLDMAKTDQRYGNDSYVPAVLYSAGTVAIGFKTDQGYEEPFWLYDDKSGHLVETDGGFFEEWERLNTSAAPELVPEPNPLYGARVLEDGRIGYLSADGTEVSSLWYGNL